MPFLVIGTIDEAGDLLPIASISHQAADDVVAKPPFVELCSSILRQHYQIVTGKDPSKTPIEKVLLRLPYYVGVILENVEPVVEAFYLQQALEQQKGCLLKLWITGER